MLRFVQPNAQEIIVWWRTVTGAAAVPPVTADTESSALYGENLYGEDQ